MRNQRRRGTAVVEFALVVTAIVMVMMGTVVVGLNLGRNVQSAQVSRDAASMFVRGVDFSKTANKNIVVRLAQGLGMTAAGGEGNVILSKVTWIPQSTCVDLGLLTCNGNSHVIVQRIYIGNTSLRQSLIGTPNTTLLDSIGLVRDYIKEPSAVASFEYLQLENNEYAYIAESYFRLPALDFGGMTPGNGVYSISVF